MRSVSCCSRGMSPCVEYSLPMFAKNLRPTPLPDESFRSSGESFAFSPEVARACAEVLQPCGVFAWQSHDVFRLRRELVALRERSSDVSVIPSRIPATLPPGCFRIGLRRVQLFCLYHQSHSMHPTPVATSAAAAVARVALSRPREPPLRQCPRIAAPREASPSSCQVLPMTVTHHFGTLLPFFMQIL